jgi:Ring hydroxylating alpha subunit (catalytic domain)
MDPDAMPLEQYLGEIPAHFKAWDFENWFISSHVGKVIDANWKVALEAFLETWQVLAPHSQVLPFVGDANSQYDVRTDQQHTSRLIIPLGIASPFVAESTSGREILERMGMQLGCRDDLRLPPGKTARQYSAELMRERMSRMTSGRDFFAVSDSTMLDALVYFVFPNFIMWGGYSNLLYRFRPWGSNPEQSIMEMILFPPTPKDAPAPPPANMNLLWLDKTFADTPEWIRPLAPYAAGSYEPPCV